MARELVQTRADEDTVEALEAYADDAEITRSEAIRRAVRSHLAEEGYPVAAADGAGAVRNRIDGLEDTVASRLDEIEKRDKQRENFRQAQTRLTAAAFVWLGGTVLVSPTGLVEIAWAAAGLIVAGLLVWISTARLWGGTDG